MEHLDSFFDRLKYGEDIFHDLMRWRVRRVLLVLPHYDAWTLEHDAKLADQIVGEYHQLNLTTVPRLVTVPDGRRALELLEAESFDLIITGMRAGDISPFTLAREAKALRPDLASLILFSSRSELAVMGDPRNADWTMIEAPFLWTGDSRLLLAMIKYVEDKRNAPNDAAEGPVGVLLVVEDSIPFYSAYLPLLYGEVMTQTQHLIAEEMNDADKYYRMRTRPKVLLARNWEEATALTDKYRNSLIGVISDISFHREGIVDEKAGFDFMKSLRDAGVSAPMLMQSSDVSLAAEARHRGARFQAKRADNLHSGIRRFLLEELGFGDFVFRDNSGQEIRRARTLHDFELAITDLPTESILYHGNRNDYSTWLAAHGEYQVSRRIKTMESANFTDAEAQRSFLAQSFRAVREKRHRGRLVDFRPDDPGALGSIGRIGSGSLGGKGRGLAFFNTLLAALPWGDRFSPLKIAVPRTLIIATGEFDHFLNSTGLPGDRIGDDQALRRSFLEAPLSENLNTALAAFLQEETGSLAIRSSGLLEDSQSLSLAGLYDTYMIPPDKDFRTRLKQLSDAVRLVWASTFINEAEAFREALSLGREDEKMAVVIQQMAGSRHSELFFPRLSGIAQSLNFYPIDPLKRSDGVARIALGLGRSVVGGGRAFMFSPRHPDVPYSSPNERWKEGQSHFWALNLDSTGKDLSTGEKATLVQKPIGVAEKLGILRHMVSTWDPDNQQIRDGLDHAGPRVLDFRDILDYEWLPLAPLLDELLQMGRRAFGIPVELEFALDWRGDRVAGAIFSLLQVRPLSSLALDIHSTLEPPPASDLLLHSEKAMGQGVVDNIQDILWVDPELYSSEKTEEFRDGIADEMDRLAAEGRTVLLIGPGRWGSRDRFLGIPVSWAQVRQARFIVEVISRPEDPEPSQGSHFFHNLVSLGAGYAHVHASGKDKDFIDWSWLREHSGGTGPIHSIHLEKPLRIVMDGRRGWAWVEK